MDGNEQENDSEIGFDEIISNEDGDDQQKHKTEEDDDEQEHHFVETEFDIVNMTTVMFDDDVDMEKDL